MTDSHHTDKQIAAAFTYAPTVLKRLAQAGVKYPKLELFADASGALILAENGTGDNITREQYELASDLVFSRRPIMDSKRVGIVFCCGLVTGAEKQPGETPIPEVAPKKSWDGEMPRRSRIDLMKPEELAIRSCIIEVEKLGAHSLLTDCVSLLGDAQSKLADWFDHHALEQRYRDSGGWLWRLISRKGDGAILRKDDGTGIVVTERQLKDNYIACQVPVERNKQVLPEFEDAKFTTTHRGTFAELELPSPPRLSKSERVLINGHHYYVGSVEYMVPFNGKVLLRVRLAENDDLQG